MSDTNKKDSMETNHIDKLYQDEYIRHIHKIGTVTVKALLVISFLPAIYVSFVKGMHPGWGVIGKAAVTLLGINVFQWIIEPIIYFPMIGITGSYIGFVAGNITPMRIPAAIAAQNAVDAKQGTKKGEFAGVIGIVASVIVNFVVLAIVILFGSYLISILPSSVKDALQFALPGVFGALLVTFVSTLLK